LATAAAGVLLAFGPSGRFASASVGGGSSDGDVRPAKGSLDLPGEYVAALSEAWKQVDSLSEKVASQGVVPGFGRKAEAIVRRAVASAGASGNDASGLEAILDAPLKVLFAQQLQSLLAKAVDHYDAEMTARPNPLEAGIAAAEFFERAAAELKRPGGDWSSEAEKQDLLARVDQNYGRDWQLVNEQAKQGQGKQVTIEVIRKLQEQAASVQREMETRGAFPWKVKWQYFLENSPLGFRGQYAQGRSIVELLLMPSPDPRQKNNLLNKIGPLNLAVAFDMLM